MIFGCDYLQGAVFEVLLQRFTELVRPFWWKGVNNTMFSRLCIHLRRAQQDPFQKKPLDARFMKWQWHTSQTSSDCCAFIGSVPTTPNLDIRERKRHINF